ncbi:PREDICTED: dual serine/threonine and tyrosine protein kinase-like [Acropora digitifera]|uniref:dual serine/threonine and tyrosine protein kinase-like n=1 Tax=Acropora digitifera TaxID=70779 RepID=UPI00077AF333|nr:PREDICTED: dual serine/threonine and tyrosine protein kinase-like [Acropora digitifera]XP_015763095.1 PREDICTED: dual serine/threonine and tyrosine protein kinase-like [Acropora digitifera]
MAANLPYEIAKFQEHSRLLKQIKRNTNRYFREIQDSGHFSQEVLSAYLPENDSQSLTKVCEKPPTIIVIGQTCFAKVCVINELLGEPILPVVGELDSRTSWRMIRLKYGNISNVSLVLPDSFELAANLDAYEGSWESVPRADLELTELQRDDPAMASAVAEVSLNHPLLKAGAELVCSPSNHEGDVENILRACCEDVLPIVLYALEFDMLTERDKAELLQVKAFAPDMAVFFVKCNRKAPVELTNSMTESGRNEVLDSMSEDGLNSSMVIGETKLRTMLKNSKTKLFEQLCELKYLSAYESNENVAEGNDQLTNSSILAATRPKSNLIEDFALFPCFLLFVRQVLQYNVVWAATVLNEAHVRVLGMFITTAFDMARDMVITPRRLDYAREKEEDLYKALMESASRKQEEIRDLIHSSISSLTPDLLKEVENLKFEEVKLAEDDELANPKDLQHCTAVIQELVLTRINNSVAQGLISSVRYLQDNFIGTLKRCVESLEQMDAGGSNDSGENATTSLKRVLDSAYQIEVTVRASSSLARLLWEKMKQAIQTLPGQAPPKIDGAWKRKVAQDMLVSLSESRLAKHICAQFRLRLQKSHEAFATSMRILEAHHCGRLEKTEEKRMKVRKCHAPKIAKLALESTSLRDVVVFGMPQMGREVGRGQYGVVYSCEKWAGRQPCAIKSVVPPDDKHWNDLALEFFYTRSIPKHNRIVSIIGSVIDYSYGGGTSPAVLLVMDRLQKDLYQGIKAGLNYRGRLVVALDVVEGIRFLHSQGLVHRDIKLKNVLLDARNRGKITDLGFCKPEAMMSGSIVGTPIHMAPELFSGRYDNSVDVYAFGILFWYICAGTVRLPLAFEQCSSKDHLWSAVRRGVRPERLANFDDECWTLMEQCWSGDPSGRPLLGLIQPRLMDIIKRAESRRSTSVKQRQQNRSFKELEVL